MQSDDLYSWHLPQPFFDTLCTRGAAATLSEYPMYERSLIHSLNWTLGAVWGLCLEFLDGINSFWASSNLVYHFWYLATQSRPQLPSPACLRLKSLPKEDLVSVFWNKVLSSTRSSCKPSACDQCNGRLKRDKLHAILISFRRLQKLMHGKEHCFACELKWTAHADVEFQVHGIWRCGTYWRPAVQAYALLLIGAL